MLLVVHWMGKRALGNGGWGKKNMEKWAEVGELSGIEKKEESELQFS